MLWELPSKLISPLSSFEQKNYHGQN